MRKTYSIDALRNALGASVTDLSKIFGVSRQAIYMWKKGSGMTPENMAKVNDLVKAVDVFQDFKILPNSNMLNRPILNGRSFVQLVNGAPCSAAMAKRLVDIVLREDLQRAKFARRFAHSPRPDFPDIGMPKFEEGRQ